MMYRAGDIFCVGTDNIFGKLIRVWTRIWSFDDKVNHNHSGIIINSNGDTFEALASGIKIGNISKYKNNTLLVARLKNTPPGQIERAIKITRSKYDGKVYPRWRIPLFFVPFLAKYISTGIWYVCSEVTAFFIFMLGKWPRKVAGSNPDHIADYIRENTDDFEIITDRRIL